VWLLREAVGPVDLVRWTLGGQLPYLELPHVSKAALAGAPPEFPLQLLQPQGAPCFGYASEILGSHIQARTPVLCCSCPALVLPMPSILALVSQTPSVSLPQLT